MLARRLPGIDPGACRVEPVGGLTGESWRIRAPGVDWLVRAATPQHPALGVDRQREYRILRHLQPRQLAPRPIAPKTPWLVVEWLAGETLSAADWHRALADGTLAGRLLHLHRGPRCGYPLALRPRYAACWQASDPGRRSPAWLRLHQRFMRGKMPAPLHIVPLHMDVHPGNLVRADDGGLRLIDWEYAGDGDIALELAALARGNQLDGRQCAALLAGYHAASPGYSLAALRRQVAAWTPWVDYLMLMWYEARWGQTGRRQFILQAVAPRRRLGLAGGTN